MILQEGVRSWPAKPVMVSKPFCTPEQDRN